MKQLLIERLDRSFRFYQDLIEFLPEQLLRSKLQGLPSNELGHQLWCVIGARNSYLNALKAGKWEGFSCPLSPEETGSKEAVSSALAATAANVLEFLTVNSDYDENILMDLFEHEIQHQGQIIRYLYGLKAGIPESWKNRYNLD